MTDEQINQRIAEACGLRPKRIPVYYPRSGMKIETAPPPDYCTDLNAMHEAEKVLSKEQIEIYCDAMWPKGHGWWWAIHTTARQRAEAFLRTLGKWEATDKESLTVQDVGWPPPGTRCSRMNADGKWEEVQG